MAPTHVLQYIVALCGLSAGEAYPEDSRLNQIIDDPRAALLKKNIPTFYNTLVRLVKVCTSTDAVPLLYVVPLLCALG